MRWFVLFCFLAPSIYAQDTTSVRLEIDELDVRIQNLYDLSDSVSVALESLEARRSELSGIIAAVRRGNVSGARVRTKAYTPLYANPTVETNSQTVKEIEGTVTKLEGIRFFFQVDEGYLAGLDEINSSSWKMLLHTLSH